MATITAKWTKLISSPILQRSSHGVSVIDNAIYIFGGELRPREPRDNDVHRLTLTQSTISSPTATLTTLPAPQSTSTAPTPRVGSPTATIKDTIYLFSGRGGIAMAPIAESGTLWSFTPSTTTWTPIQPADATQPAPEPRSYHAVCADEKSGTVWVHAGCPEKGRRGDLWKFVVGERKWVEVGGPEGKERGGTGLCVAGGRLWRFGGFDGSSEVGGVIDSMALEGSEEGKWRVEKWQGEGPGARSVAGLVGVDGGKDGELVVSLFGEGDPSSLGHAGAGKMWPDVWAWKVDGGGWTKVVWEGEGPQARGWFDADKIKLADGTEGVVVSGGLGESNDRLDDVWLLTFN